VPPSGRIARSFAALRRLRMTRQERTGGSSPPIILVPGAPRSNLTQKHRQDLKRLELQRHRPPLVIPSRRRTRGTPQMQCRPPRDQNARPGLRDTQVSSMQSGNNCRLGVLVRDPEAAALRFSRHCPDGAGEFPQRSGGILPPTPAA
jgi:hypothetical protein